MITESLWRTSSSASWPSMTSLRTEPERTPTCTTSAPHTMPLAAHSTFWWLAQVRCLALSDFSGFHLPPANSARCIWPLPHEGRVWVAASSNTLWRERLSLALREWCWRRLLFYARRFCITSDTAFVPMFPSIKLLGATQLITLNSLQQPSPNHALQRLRVSRRVLSANGAAPTFGRLAFVPPLGTRHAPPSLSLGSLAIARAY